MDWTHDGNLRLTLELPDGIDASIDVPATGDDAQVYVDGGRVDAERVGERLVLDGSYRGDVVVEVKR